MSRPETGPMKFGDDWTGVFIRGDNAFMYTQVIEVALEHVPPELFIAVAGLKGLLEDLRQSKEGVATNVQHLKTYKDCVQESSSTTSKG